MGATGKSGIKGVREASLKRRENLEPAPECGEEGEILREGALGGEKNSLDQLSRKVGAVPCAP